MKTAIIIIADTTTTAIRSYFLPKYGNLKLTHHGEMLYFSFVMKVPVLQTGLDHFFVTSGAESVKQKSKKEKKSQNSLIHTINIKAIQMRMYE